MNGQEHDEACGPQTEDEFEEMAHRVWCRANEEAEAQEELVEIAIKLNRQRHYGRIYEGELWQAVEAYEKKYRSGDKENV